MADACLKVQRSYMGFNFLVQVLFWQSPERKACSPGGAQNAEEIGSVAILRTRAFCAFAVNCFWDSCRVAA